MRILFVKPPFNTYSFVQHFMVCEPLEFEMLASQLVQHHDVQIVDMRLEKRSLEALVLKFRPDVVGFTALTMDVNTVHQLATKVKKVSREIVTCVGGEHASLAPRDFETSDIDHVFVYDALKTFPAFLQNLEQRRRQPFNDMERYQVNTAVNDAEALRELPVRKLCDQYLSKYTYGCANPVNLIQMTAGCSYRCSYCSIPSRQLSYTKRTIETVLADAAKTKARDLLSIDANALQDITYSRHLYKEIANAHLRKRLMISCRTDTISKHPDILPILKDAGVSVIAFGIESFDDRALADFNKRNSALHNRRAVDLVHRHGILVRGNFIIDQTFSQDDFSRLVDDVFKHEIEFPTFQILTPLPGTDLYRNRKSDLLTNNFDYFDLSHSVLPTVLPRETFHSEFQQLFRACYGVRRIAWLASKLPVSSTFRGAAIALRSHLAFTYSGHMSEGTL